MDSVHEHLRGDAPAARRMSTARPDSTCAFRCFFRTSMSAYDHGGLYVAAYEGEIHAFLDDEFEQPAGHARLFVLNADAAERDGESLFNLLDTRSETSPFIPLLGDEEGELAPAVREVLDEPVITCRNMLLLDRLEILPAFRGQDLGLRYLAAAITRFGLGCRLAAARLLPPPGACASGKVVALRMTRTKLRRYYAQAGFVALPRSDLMIMDLERQHPGER
jgi:GNAT superfamily N-acetyltransferase